MAGLKRGLLLFYALLALFRGEFRLPRPLGSLAPVQPGRRQSENRVMAKAFPEIREDAMPAFGCAGLG
jgi:hypothetical protein